MFFLHPRPIGSIAEADPTRRRVLVQLKPTRWEASRLGAIMTRTDHCQDCKGGGLVPGPGCACAGNVHTRTPGICPTCPGTGTVAEPRVKITVPLACH